MSALTAQLSVDSNGSGLSQGRGKILVYGLVLLGYFCLAVLFTYPMILHMEDLLFGNRNTLAGVWAFSMQTQELFVNHPFHFYAAFNPPLNYPMSYSQFNSATSIILSLLYAPAYLITKNEYFSHNLLILFGLTTTPFAIFLLARYWLRHERAAFLAGVAYGFTSINFSFIMDADFMIVPIIWLLILSFERFSLEGRLRYLYVFAVTLTVTFYYMAHLFTLGVYFILVMIMTIRRRNIFQRKYIYHYFAAGLLSLMLALPLAIPYLERLVVYDISGELVSADPTVTGKTTTFMRITVPAVGEWLKVMPSNWLYGKLLPDTWTGPCYHFGLFPGVALIILVFIGCLRMPPSKISRRFLALTLLVSMVLVTGIFPLHFNRQQMDYWPVFLLYLYKMLPYLTFFRCAYRLLLLVMMAGAILAAGGYCFLENKMSLRWGKRKASLLIIPAVFLICLENISIPVPLFNFDHLIAPGDALLWLKERGLPERDNELILHFPDTFFTDQNNAHPDSCLQYEEALNPLLQNVQYNHFIANGYTSYVPRGWIPQPMTLMPRPQAQKYFRALGVRYIIVHEDLFYGYYQQIFSRENLTKNGLKFIKTFPDRESLYLLDRPVKMVKALYLVPRFEGKRLELWAVTPEYYDTYKSGFPINADDAMQHWFNPDVCRYQKITVQILDAQGKNRSERFRYYLPRIEGGVPHKMLEWDLGELAFPVKLDTISVSADYLIQPPDQVFEWKLEKN